MGNVVLFFSHEKMCAQMAGTCGRDADEVYRLVMDSGLQRRFECGLSVADYHRAFEAAVRCPVPRDELLEAHCDIFELNEALVPVLDALKSRGMRLVLLSNTDAAHFEFIRRRFDVLEYFEECVLSFRVGAMKPAEAIYRAAIEAAGCAAHECFYTDDIAEYVHAARRFGLPAETFTGVPALREHLASRGVLAAARLVGDAEALL
ncbi:MAG: HAD-IA family hydrolase [Planctomycetes bacterium]|nr:HAD-IA family hydrolase [Planctomycetota bacterium]